MISSRLLLIAAAAMLAAGCAKTTFEARPGAPRLPCPPVKAYTAKEQARADAELAKVHPPCILCDMMDDYLAMRDQCRVRPRR